MTLGADITIEGIEEASSSVTELGKAVENLDPIAERMSKILQNMEGSLSMLTQEIEKHQTQVEQLANKSQQQDKTNRSEEAERRQEAEERRLRAKMAQLVGGGVNSAQYQIQLEKVQAQMDAIREAEAKGLITSRESLLAVAGLGKEYLKLKTEAIAYSAAGGGAVGRIAAAGAQKITSLPGQAVGAVGSQVSGIGSGVMGLMSSLPIAGGLFGLMMYGVMNTDRIKAETGEIMNIVASATGGMSDTAVKFLGDFQQQASHLWGIQKGEIQSVLKTFTDAGLTANTIMTQQKANLGIVGHDIMTLTLALDKNFELATGSSARSVVALTNDFGMGIKEAGDLYERMAFAGSRSGMGVQNFLNYVMQGSSALRQYGVSVEQVETTLLTIQERYESLGMTKQLAGNQAGLALGQISQGIGGMSQSMQAYFGERMGLGTGLEARMNFRDGMSRLSKGTASDTFMTSFIEQAYRTAMESGGGDKPQARFLLENQGFGAEGAKAIIEIGDKVAHGVKFHELSAAEQKAIKESLTTEGQKTSDIQKDIWKIMQGMAQVGEGILQVITNMVAWGVMGLKSIITLIAGTPEEKKHIMEVLGEFSKGMGEGFNKITDGGKNSLYGVGGLLEPIFKPLQRAMEFDPLKTESEQQFATGAKGAEHAKHALESTWSKVDKNFKNLPPEEKKKRIQLMIQHMHEKKEMEDITSKLGNEGIDFKPDLGSPQGPPPLPQVTPAASQVSQQQAITAGVSNPFGGSPTPAGTVTKVIVKVKPDQTGPTTPRPMTGH
jgi:hypothetical protein